MSLTQSQDRFMKLAAYAPITPRPSGAGAANLTSQAKAIAFAVTVTLATVILGAYWLTWSSASSARR